MDDYELRIIYTIYKYASVIYKTKNVVGFGLGKKSINGNTIDIPCLKIFVTSKVSQNMLDKQDIIPKTFCGVLTDVQAIELKKEYIQDYGNVNGGEKKTDYPATAGRFILNTSIQNSPVGSIAIATTENAVGYNKEGNIYTLSTARILTSNFQGRLGNNISMKSSVNQYTNVHLGILSKFTDVTIMDVKDGNIVYNEIDAGIANVQKIKDVTPENVILAPGLFNNSTVFPYDKIHDTTQLYFFHKSTVISCTLEASDACAKFTLSKNKEINYSKQFLIKAGNVSPEDCGSLVFQNITSPWSKEDWATKPFLPNTNHYAIGMIIGPVFADKSNTLMCTPINKILQHFNLKLFKSSQLTPQMMR